MFHNRQVLNKSPDLYAYSQLRLTKCWIGTDKTEQPALNLFNLYCIYYQISRNT